MAGGRVRLGQAAGFLAERYQGRARDISELGGGDWSRAFAFRLDGCDLVARFGRYGEDFAKDQEAMAFAGPDLPVPRVLEVGNALGGAYAISERHFGLFLENLDEPRWRRLLPALVRGLDHLRHLQAPAASQVPSAAGGPATTMTWREWLLRLRCYELHIGLTHLAYRAFAGRRAEDLHAVARRTREILEAGNAS